MGHQRPEGPASLARFGQRKVRPRACTSDGKRHIRTFLTETLEELGFVTCECAGVGELGAVLDARPPDLLVLGPVGRGDRRLRDAAAARQQEFRRQGSAAGSARFAPGESRPRARRGTGTYDAAGSRHAVRQREFTHQRRLAPARSNRRILRSTLEKRSALAGFELWYQPKIDTHTLSLSGAEALVRMRHPAWGTVPPGFFVLDDGDPHFRALSEFVIGQAVADWRDFVHQHGHVEIAINLPVRSLQDPDLLGEMCRSCPSTRPLKD